MVLHHSVDWRGRVDLLCESRRWPSGEVCDSARMSTCQPIEIHRLFAPSLLCSRYVQCILLVCTRKSIEYVYVVIMLITVCQIMEGVALSRGFAWFPFLCQLIQCRWACKAMGICFSPYNNYSMLCTTLWRVWNCVYVNLLLAPQLLFRNIHIRWQNTTL